MHHTLRRRVDGREGWLRRDGLGRAQQVARRRGHCCFCGRRVQWIVSFFGNLTASGLTHSGDNQTGEGDGDDEQLKVNLQDIPAHVTQIIFVVNIYTKGFTFKSVRNPYCRIFDESGEELARYQLTEAGSQSGLIVARMFRA